MREGFRLLTPLIVVVLPLVLIALGVDIFISLGLAGVLGILLFLGADELTLAATSFCGQETTFEFLALPLFVLMGHILAKSPIGSDLNTMATRWLSWPPGGLAIASIGACTVFGAVSGVSFAGTLAMPIPSAFPLSSTERSPVSREQWNIFQF